MLFAKDKHIRYWRMCTQNLPDYYTGNDSSRMTLGFFTLAALDLLGALTSIDKKERQGWVDWIYSCQSPEGGFRGFTGTDLRSARTATNRHWDPSTVPATFFALATLILLEDDLSRVNRQECLTWLPRLQRDDGSFGELLCDEGRIEGDGDLRQCCCAAGIAYMLIVQGQQEPAFDEDKLISYIQTCQSQSGGFGVSPLKEAHSGLSYCAIATLSFLRRLHSQPPESAIDYVLDPEQCLRWLLDRQTDVINNGEDEDADKSKNPQLKGENATMTDDTKVSETQIAGFNGRYGKIADTCYAFWNGGALAILGYQSLVDSDGMMRYLFEITQHQIGGFGKCQGAPPDILHAYLGLAAMGTYGHPEVKSLDPTMCISSEAVSRLEHLSWKTVTSNE